MKFTLAIAALLVSVNAVTLRQMDPSTGAPIPICNGANSSQCTEADEVVKHRVARPFKKLSDS